MKHCKRSEQHKERQKKKDRQKDEQKERVIGNIYWIYWM